MNSQCSLPHPPLLALFVGVCDERQRKMNGLKTSSRIEIEAIFCYSAILLDERILKSLNPQVGLHKILNTKIHELPNKHTRFSPNFSPTGFSLFFLEKNICAKTPLKLVRGWETLQLAAPPPTKTHGLQSLRHASCGDTPMNKGTWKR